MRTIKGLFIIYLVIAVGSGPEVHYFSLKNTSQKKFFLAPKSHICSHVIDQVFEQSTNIEQLEKSLLELAPSLERKEDLIYLARKFGQIKEIWLSNELKIDLYEDVLTLAPGNPLHRVPYQFVRNEFFIPLIVKEEALQLKFYAGKNKRNELALLDMGSGNGAVLWLLRQLLFVVGLPNQKIVILDISEEALKANKKLNDDLPEESFIQDNLNHTGWYQQSGTTSSLPSMFDAVFFRHTLHEVYSSIYRDTGKASSAKDRVVSLLRDTAEIMRPQSLLYIHDSVLPEHPDEMITVQFNKVEIENAWSEFLRLWPGEGKAVKIKNFPATYKVSKKTYVHFLTKVWYLVKAQKNPAYSAKRDHEMEMITSFSTESEMVSLLEEAGFHALLAYGIKENPYLSFVNGAVDARTIEGNKFIPKQFVNFLATKFKPPRKLPFVSSMVTYDGPRRNWLDSLEYRQGRRKLETEMYRGMLDVVNKLAIPLTFFLARAIELNAKENLFSKEQINTLKEVSRQIDRFKEYELIDDTHSMLEKTTAIESWVFWKYNVTTFTQELLSWLEDKPVKDDFLVSLIEMMQKLLDDIKSFHYFFTPKWNIPEDIEANHKRFFEELTDNNLSRGWMKRHVHFQIGHPFEINWSVDQDVLDIDIETFRTMMYLLFFIGKENARPPKYQESNSPFEIHVVQYDHDLVLKLVIEKNSDSTRDLSNQEKVLFAKRMAAKHGGAFRIEDNGVKSEIYFRLPIHFRSDYLPRFMSNKVVERSL